jgi:hypothetical protein
MVFERRHEPLLPRHLFLRRMARWSALAATILLGSLMLGVLGYHYLERLPWIDALLNASMIAGGMGPVDPVKTTAGKLFASFYALYSGLAIISAAGVLFAPIFHRFMHHFHVETKPD